MDLQGNYKNYNGNEGIAIYVSRYTPGLKNGKDIDFKIGEHVKYKSLKDGIDYGDVIIDSMRMSHSETDKLGYEAIFPNGRFFIAAEGIYDWKGRVA